MRHVFYIILILSGTFACTNDTDENNLNPADVKTLRDEVAMLKSENLRKDSLITQSITYFNEIERNLSSIDLKEKEIRNEFKELSTKQDGKEVILQKIKYINDLRLENGRKMYALQQKLDTINVAENEFKEILKRLQLEIKQKDKEMNLLQQTLVQKDKEYANLFADYQRQVGLYKEQELKNNEASRNLNTVYYAFGNQKELKSNNIISVKKKVLAANKITLNENFNESYFTAIQLDETREIMLEGKKPSLITDHPESSYQIVTEGGKTKLKILNPAMFWKVSRYLVVMTD